ncbi:hypothetical protein R1flu_023242 [Riccia fluitans]|uniref:Uncharacterized protein n=1 Tax=Riccia fluitans TaxID=41844 RepID=A0ABD1XRI8_9MARC
MSGVRILVGSKRFDPLDPFESSGTFSNVQYREWRPFVGALACKSSVRFAVDSGICSLGYTRELAPSPSR